MMKIFAVAGWMLLLGGALFADDPCQALGIPGPYTDVSGLGNGACNGVPTSNAHLIAHIINNQVAEMKTLKDAIDALTKAVAALDSTSKDLVAADQKFQSDTLKATIDAVDKVPAALAAEKSLQDVLLAAIKDQLLKDPTFLQAIKKAP